MDSFLQNLDSGGDYFGQDRIQYPLSFLAFQDFGELYAACNRYVQGKKCYRTALRLVLEVYGEHHVHTLNVMSNLASFHQYSGNPQAALEVWLKITQTLEEHGGAESPSAMAYYHNIGWAYMELGQLDKAREMCERALTGRLKMLGPRHAQTAETLNNYANLKIELGELESAEEMLNQSISIATEQFGEKHAITVNYMDSLGALLNKKEDYEAGLDLLSQVLDAREDIYGKMHFRISETLVNLGNSHEGLEDLREAEAIFSRALGGYTTIFGENYPLSKKTTDALVRVQQKIADASNSFL